MNLKTPMNNKFLLAVLALVGLFLIVFLGAKTRNAWQEYYYIGKSGRDTITIDGQGKVNAKPDVSLVSLGVVTEALKVKDAQSQNSEKMNAIIEAIKGMGVEAKDIQTENYNLSPKYDWTDGKQKLLGYIVSQNVSVKVRDTDKVGDIISKAGELGANQVGGIQFVIDDPNALQAQSRDKAIEDARQKAKTLSDKLGLQVVRVVSFSEYSGGTPSPTPYYAMAKDARNTQEMAAPPSIEVGSQDVVTNVSVTFEVR